MNHEVLKRIAVLQSMPPDALASLADVLEQAEYSDGQAVFAEGEPADSMYFITRGCVRIEKRVGRGQKTLALLEAGDYFGEMGLLDQKPRSGSAIATGGASILRLSKTVFDRIHARNSAVALSILFNLIRTSSERIRWLNTQLVAYDEIGKAIGEAPDLTRLLESVLEQVSTASGADWGFLALRSEFSGRLDIRARKNLTLTSAQEEAVQAGDGFLGPILRDPQDLLAPNLGEHDFLKSCPRLGFETEGLLVSSILLSDQVVGLIVLGSNKPNQFDLNVLNLARGVARQAAQAILNSRRREQDEARLRRPPTRV